MSAVALCTDLFFVSKIKGTADAIGVPLEIVRTGDALRDAVAGGAALVIVDMNASVPDLPEVIRQCKEAAGDPFVIAYLSHVQVDLQQAAQQAGADLVLPRSRFSAELPQLLETHRHGRSSS